MIAWLKQFFCAHPQWEIVARVAGYKGPVVTKRCLCCPKRRHEHQTWEVPC